MFSDNDFVNQLNDETITGHKFNDWNANGFWDEGEPTLEGWTIKLQVAEEIANANAAAVSDAGWTDFLTTKTLADGSYKFENVPANKTYRVVEEMQDGWHQSYPESGFYLIDPKPGGTFEDKDFGNWTNGRVSGFKFEDINENGEWDTEAIPPEVGLPTWTIQALDAEGKVVASTVTGDGGAYALSLPPGTYTLREVMKTDDPWRQTAPVGGSFTVTVKSDEASRPVQLRQRSAAAVHAADLRQER